jgi:hypothetical protein
MLIRKYIVTRRLEQTCDNDRLEPPASLLLASCHYLACARPEYSSSGQAIVNAVYYKVLENPQETS